MTWKIFMCEAGLRWNGLKAMFNMSTPLLVCMPLCLTELGGYWLPSDSQNK